MQSDNLMGNGDFGTGRSRGDPASPNVNEFFLGSLSGEGVVGPENYVPCAAVELASVADPKYYYVVSRA